MEPHIRRYHHDKQIFIIEDLLMKHQHRVLDNTLVSEECNTQYNQNE